MHQLLPAALYNSITVRFAGAAEIDSRVNSTLGAEDKAALMALPGWRGFNNPWMAEGEEGEEYLYINLLVNPERYTGESGETLLVR